MTNSELAQQLALRFISSQQNLSEHEQFYNAYKEAYSAFVSLLEKDNPPGEWEFFA